MLPLIVGLPTEGLAKLTANKVWPPKADGEAEVEEFSTPGVKGEPVVDNELRDRAKVCLGRADGFAP